MTFSRKTGILLLVVGAIIGVVGGAMIGIGLDARKNAIMTLSGELMPFDVDMSKPFTVALSPGIDWFVFSSTQLANGIDLNDILPANFTTNKLQIQFIDNKLSVSADIKDSNNKRIAQIVNNEWKTVDPSTLLFWDRNYNAYAFEIIGSNNIPTLQVIMVGPNKIQIGGLFYTDFGSIYVAPMGQDAVLYVNVGDEHREEEENITIFFKYPALTNPDNLGKITNPIYPSSDPLAESTWIIVLGVVLAPSGTILFAFGFDKYKKGERGTEKKRKNRIGQRKPYYRSRKRKKR